MRSDLTQVLELQGMLLLIILAGALLRRRKLISDGGVQTITDLCLNLVIPCNIIKSFLISPDESLLRSCTLILLLSAAVQAAAVLLNRVLYRRCDPAHLRVLQYSTICSNAGFLGNTVAEGLYGDLGLLYNSIFLIPVRFVVWSVGPAYFTVAPSRKEMVRKILTHPCLVAGYIGLVLMLFQIPVPSFLERTLRSVGGCTTTLTMLIVGVSLADVDLRALADRTALYFSALRLIAFPAATLLLCRALRMDAVSTGVAVLMTGMPAGSTGVIFAAKYHSDEAFAAKCVVLSTMLSMLTIPLWRLYLGR